eukprot:evm.model.scf_150EXC.11 EVM.evm.TU.scf_150EXC.11   scf_150EXC:103548-105549(-)
MLASSPCGTPRGPSDQASRNRNAFIAAAHRANGAEKFQPLADGSRRAVLGALAFLAPISVPPKPRGAQSRLPVQDGAAGVAYGAVVDPGMAYQFAYPLETISRRRLPIVRATGPVHYASGAPMGADDRQRIVCELVDRIDGVSVCVSVGPPGGDLPDTHPEDWLPEQVARSVLVGRSAASQPAGDLPPMPLKAARSETHDDQVYWYYEHASRSSEGSAKRSLAVTSWREGAGGEPYLYTLSLTAPQGLWRDVGPLCQGAVESFRLSAVSKDYVPPDGEESVALRPL